MAMVNPISLTAPMAGAPGVPQPTMPRSRSELMAYLLERNAPATPDYSSVQSPVEGFAKALTSGLQGYMGKKALQGEEEQKQARANAIADLLFGPSADGAPDPRRDQLASMLSSGAVGPDAFGGAIASKLGLGDPPEPTTLSAGETIGTWSGGAFKPAYTAPKSAGPVEPYSNAGEIKADLDAGFLTEEEAQLALSKLGAGTTINVGQSEYGTIPQGYQLVRDPQTGALSMEIIPGGPADIEAQATAEQEAVRQGTKETASSIVVEDIDRAIDMIETANIPATGVIGWIASGVPGTAAFNVSRLLDTVKANAGFDKLQAMRDASPTGGALGQVSEFENRLLQATIGSLEQSQDKDQLIYNLRRVQNIYDAIINRGIQPGDPLLSEDAAPSSAKPRLKFNPATGELE